MKLLAIFAIIATTAICQAQLESYGHWRSTPGTPVDIDIEVIRHSDPNAIFKDELYALDAQIRKQKNEAQIEFAKQCDIGRKRDAEIMGRLANLKIEAEVRADPVVNARIEANVQAKAQARQIEQAQQKQLQAQAELLAALEEANEIAEKQLSAIREIRDTQQDNCKPHPPRDDFYNRLRRAYDYDRRHDCDN